MCLKRRRKFRKQNKSIGKKKKTKRKKVEMRLKLTKYRKKIDIKFV